MFYYSTRQKSVSTIVLGNGNNSVCHFWQPWRSVPFYSVSFCFALHARFAARLWREMPSFIVELPGTSDARAVVKGGVVRTVL